MAKKANENKTTGPQEVFITTSPRPEFYKHDF
jgi:hypothetical protein